MFTGRSLLIATKHRKEEVIAPLLEKGLEVKCLVAEKLDTDLLGTFTGEVERCADPLATARRKCEMAMALHGCDLAVASEGSFGPHPEIGFVPANEEILLLLDKKNNLEIVVRELSLETNFAGEKISTEEQLLAFAERAGFPSHALVLRTSDHASSGNIKGIMDRQQLLESFHELRQRQEEVYVETDMRAMHNPTRKAVIKKAAQKLLQKALSCCPQCQTPGFGVTSVKVGLPCELCGFPSRSVLSATSSCQKCAYTAEQKYPHGKTVEDPMYCQLCNP